MSLYTSANEDTWLLDTQELLVLSTCLRKERKGMALPGSPDLKTMFSQSAPEAAAPATPQGRHCRRLFEGDFAPPDEDADNMDGLFLRCTLRYNG